MKKESCLSVVLSAKAFTLIELLVVVLIIGILAAVALPKYQMAVAKSRLVQLKNIVTRITEAQEVYYLANGKYSSSLEELDIDVPAGDTDTRPSAARYNGLFCFTGYNGIEIVRTICYDTNAHFGYGQRPQNLPAAAEPGAKYCIVTYTTDPSNWRNQVCKQETGTSSKQINTVEETITYKYQ